MRRKIYISFLVVCVIFLCLFFVFNFVIFPSKYKNHIVRFASVYNLDRSLVYAIVKTESDFDKNAVSKSGAVGLMQLLPKTAQWIAESNGEVYEYNNLFNEETNIKYGCFYLRYLFDRFDDIDIVICAYNAGETKVNDWVENGVLVEAKINYPETKNYLQKVRNYRNVYKSKDLYI